MLTRRLLLAAPALLAAAPALAAWPEKSLRLVVPVVPGGSQDVFARLLARGISERIGQSLVVENRAGAGGNVAYEAVAHERPDGYTLLAGADPLSINPALFARAGFDPVRDFAPVVEGVRVAQIFVVRADSRFASLEQLVQAAARGEAVSVGTPGNGSLAHLILAQLGATSGANFTHVPYRGGAPAMTDVIGGQVQMIFDNIPGALPQYKAGKVKPFAVTSAARSPVVPEIPSISEFLPGYDLVSWTTVTGPAGLPAAVVERLSMFTQQALESASVKKDFFDRGATAIFRTPRDTVAYRESEEKRLGDIIRRAKISLD